MKLRIGIPIIGSKGWLGGISYVENIIKAIRLLPEDEQPLVYLIFTDSNLGAIPLHAHILPLFDDLIYGGSFRSQISTALGRPVPSFTSAQELYTMIDFFFMAPDHFLHDFCSAAWIPDFQHIHLPDFFHPDERLFRDNSFKYRAENAQLLVLSSHDAERDFRSQFPDSLAKTAILPFHTLPEESWLDADPLTTQKQYNLPDTFLICCNQFWIHKNHAKLFEALAILRSQGVVVPLVCTGSTDDYRCRDYYANLQQYIQELGIGEQLYILGNLPRNDQIQLIRRSLAVVQPSLFEGWSTVVEDARALGKTLFLSDLEVHKEQSPDHCIFFNRYDAGDLAKKLLKMLPILSPGPNTIRELVAKKMSKQLVTNFSRKFCKLADDAVSLFSTFQ